jgi:hypothetical protein
MLCAASAAIKQPDAVFFGIIILIRIDQFWCCQLIGNALQIIRVTYGLLIPEANSYSNSNPFSPTLRIYLFKANTLEAIAMSACTCGRSPTDNCVGWHNLTEDKYLEKKAAYEARKAEKAA